MRAQTMDERRDQLKQNIEEMKSINIAQEKRVNYLEKRATQLTVFYFIFQGMIFISISRSSSSLQCHNWWIPFNLSLLSSIIYSLTFLPTLTTFIQTWYNLDFNRLDHESMLHELHHCGLQGDLMIRNGVKPDEFQWLRRRMLACFIVIAMLAFEGTMLHACHSFLCNN